MRCLLFKRPLSQSTVLIASRLEPISQHHCIHCRSRKQQSGGAALVSPGPQATTGQAHLDDPASRDAVEPAAASGDAAEAAATDATEARLPDVLRPTTMSGSSATVSEPGVKDTVSTTAADRSPTASAERAGSSSSLAASPLQEGSGHASQEVTEWQEVKKSRKARRAGGQRLAAAEAERLRQQPGPSSRRKGATDKAESAPEKQTRPATPRPSARPVDGRPTSAEATSSRQAAEVTRLLGECRMGDSPSQQEVPLAGPAAERQPSASPARQAPLLQVNSQQEWPTLGSTEQLRPRQQPAMSEGLQQRGGNSADTFASSRPPHTQESRPGSSSVVSARRPPAPAVAYTQEALEEGSLRRQHSPRQPRPLTRQSAPRLDFPIPAFLDEELGPSVFTDDEEEDPPPTHLTPAAQAVAASERLTKSSPCRFKHKFRLFRALITVLAALDAEDINAISEVFSRTPKSEAAEAYLLGCRRFTPRSGAAAARRPRQHHRSPQQAGACAEPSAAHPGHKP